MACSLNRLPQRSFEGRSYAECADDTSLSTTAHVTFALVNELPFKQHVDLAEEVLRRYVDVQAGCGQRRTAQRRHEQADQQREKQAPEYAADHRSLGLSTLKAQF
jgi:hypothetical protein